MINNSNMVVKKRLSCSPTQETSSHSSSSESMLSLHEKFLEKMPLHFSSDSDGESESSKQSWRSPARANDTLPQWSRPPSPGEMSESSSHTSSGSGTYQSTSNNKLSAPLLLLTLALVAMTALYRARSSVATTQSEFAAMQENRLRMKEQLTKTERDFLMLKREISAMDVMIAKQQGSTDASPSAASQRMLHEMKELQDRLHMETESVSQLKDKVQSIGRSEVEEVYGHGPHQVEIELVFPDRRAGPSRFVIELAPVDQMPHSVHTFLSMVEAKLLDGCSFILNALHVLKAAPLPYDGTSAAEKAKAFTSAGLESVSFKEYSPDYPHKRYTVGFAADGSPSFYINTEDNSEIHVGDPCFGTIIDGHDAIKRLESQPTRNGIWFEKRIGIKSARILSTKATAS